MAATDATAIPVKNQAYRVTFPILDADGDLVTGATALDSEVSQDAGTFADCTNEATEIATASGMYYLDLTAAEMNADTVAVIVKTTSAGAKTTPIVLYPRDTGDLKVTMEAGGIAAASFAAGAIDAAAIATGAIDADAIAADAITAAKIANGAIDAATFAAGAIDAAAIATGAIDADAIAADAVAEIQAGLATQASVDVIDDFLDTEIAAIQAKTDNLPTDPADQSLIIAATDAVMARLGTPAGASLSADIAAIEAQTDDIGVAGAGLTDLGGMSTAMKAQVNAEALDVLNTDTFAEPGQETPAATSSLVAKIGYLFKFLRNRITQTATTLSVYNDDAVTVGQKATVSDNGTTFDRGEVTTGP